MKEATAWQDLNMCNYNIFSNKVNNLSHYNIYHGAKVVFTKTVLCAMLVWRLSMNIASLKEDYSTDGRTFFFQDLHS